MRTKTRFTRSERCQRGAFTLMEMLVVITIMVALMALSASAVLKFVAVQQTTNTKSTLDRVQSQLIRAWSKVKDAALIEPIPPNVMALAGSDANAAKRARVLYVKLKLRAAFPMNFAEAMNLPYTNPTLAAMGYSPLVPSSPVLQLSAYFNVTPTGQLAGYLPSHGILPAAVTAQATPDPRESAVCLLMALQRGVSGAGIDPSVLTAGGAAGDYNGMPYLTDAWGRPIFFSRVPAGSFYLNGNLAYPLGGQPRANDPLDPEGYLQTPGWASVPLSNPPVPTPQGATFVALTLQALAGPNSSYKLAPMIASGGPSDWSLKGLALTPAASFNPITFAPVAGSDAVFSTP